MSATDTLREDLGFGRLFQAIRDAVIVTDASTGEIVLWNHAAEAMFGYTTAEALGMPLETLVPPELKDRHRQGLSNYARTGAGTIIGSGRALELPALHKNGELVHIELVLSPVEHRGGSGSYVMGILRDITERYRAREALELGARKLQEALEQQQGVNEKLVALDRLKNEFIAIVAHDLRSPMSVISGFAQTLVDSWDDFEDAVKKDFMGRIASSVDNLAQLVEDVLQVARLEAGEFTYVPEPFSIGDLARRIVEDVSAGPTGRFEVDIPDDLPLAYADEQRQWQILTNLLSNAVKFSDPDSPISISVRAKGQMLEVAVKDQGVGIARSDLERVFEKFSRIHPQGIRKPKGTGLGLYICRSMVEAQGGKIRVESQMGEGSTFIYTLPAVGGS